MKKHGQNNGYTLIFGSVLNRNGNVRLLDRSENSESTIGFTIDDSEFKFRVQREFPPVVADLIDLAVAIHVSDRLVVQNPRQEQKRTHVVLPVRHPELLGAVSLKEKLEDLLTWATGSRWIFDFEKRIEIERSIEAQPLLFPCAPQADEAALWSGGLDALAGLYTRLRANSEKSFVLLGSGGNNYVFNLQEKVANQIHLAFPARSSLYRIPIRSHNSRKQRKNDISRARGVVFTLLGCACAYLVGQKELCVYENGVGAINLPFSAASVGLDHSRSVHPLTLLKVSNIVSEVLGQEFKIRNPFLLWTKAEMCKALVEDERTDLPPLTESCDSPHRQRPSQCGYCSSCLLRRQALAASKIEDRTRYVLLHGRQPVADPSVHLRCMLNQVHTIRSLLNTSVDPDIRWEALARKFYQLDDIVDRTCTVEGLSSADMRSCLMGLYQNYVDEWSEVEVQVSVGLLTSNNQRSFSERQYVA